jgi:hypothetical protein
MASSPEKTYVRREHRFCLSELQCLDVTISRTDEISSPEYPAELVDCSRRGMKLKVPVCLRFEETINLRLKYEDLDVWYDGVASVRHIRAQGENSWVVGCAIEPDVREDIIAKLASSSGKERRAHARFDVEGVGTIQRQGDTKKGFVTLRNVSEGGFCVDEENRHDPGDVVKLEIEDKNLQLHTIGACVRWQSASENGYITGLSFTEAEGFENLMACVSRKAEPKPSHKTERISRYVLIAALVTMIVPPALSILLQSNVPETQAEKTTIASTKPEDKAAEVPLAATEPTLDETQPEQVDTPEPEQPVDTSTAAVDREPEPESPQPEMESQSPTAEPATAITESNPAPETPIPLSPMREWVDNSGQYRITAELWDMGDDYIKIRKSDNEFKTVPLDRLSHEDLLYLLSLKTN